MKKKYDEAIEILKSCYKTHEEEGVQCCHSFYRPRQCLCLCRGNTELQKKYLAISVLPIFEVATKESYLLVEVSEPSVSGEEI